MTRESLLLATLGFYAFWYLAYAIFVGPPAAAALVAVAVAMAATTGGFYVGGQLGRRGPAEGAVQDPWLTEARLYAILRGILLFQGVSALLAIRSILSLAGDYRELFFTSQAQIFGFESFGIVFNVVAEYLGAVVFAFLLTRHDESDRNFYGYLAGWVALGTVVTLGRWFILYGLVVYLLRMSRKGNVRRVVYGLAIGVLLVAAAAAVFQCRGLSCELGSGGEGEVVGILLGGILNYFYLPVAMFDQYGGVAGYGPALNLGYFLYPVHLVVNLLGGGRFDFEYVRWATEIQEYVVLEDLGLYNALVGQVLTSYVGGGYAGVFLNFAPLGALLGYPGRNPVDRPEPWNVVAFFILVFAHLLPVISGPMFFFMALILGANALLEASRRGGQPRSEGDSST